MIKRLKLVNFIGIKSGTGKDEIELTFPKNGKIITTINGKNGSGKSTIMSMLTPFKDSFDDRKNLIIPGTEGIKEIDIEHNGHEYKIKHIYGKISYSYISEDGVELNENGGVRTCEEIIHDKLKLDKEYFKIGKLGSNTETFIQFPTTQRKVYISTFVEPVQKYLDAYKIVADKAKANMTKIKQIGNDLKKLDSIDTVLAKIAENENSLTEIDKQITEKTKSIIKLDLNINNQTDVMNDIDYIESKSLLKTKEDAVKKNYTINEKFNILYPNLSLEDCRIKLAATSKELDENKAIQTQLNSDLTVELGKQANVQNNIAKAQAQLEGKSAVDLNLLAEEIRNLKSDITDVKNNIDNDQYSLKLQKVDNKMVTYLDNFKTFMTTMTKYYSELNECTLDISTPNVDLFFKPDFAGVYKTCAKAIGDNITENKNLLEEKNNLFSAHLTNLDKLDILEKRPHECNIDTCPFIADALKYKDLPEQIQKLENIISGLKNTISTNEEKLEKVIDVKRIYAEIAKDFNTLAPKENIVYRQFASENTSITTFMKLPKNDLDNLYAEFVLRTENAINNINTLSTNQSDLEIKELQYKNLSESEKSRLYFENELLGYNKEKLVIDGNILNLNNQLTNINTKIEKLESDKTDFSDYEISLTDTADLEKEIENLKSIISKYETASKNKTLFENSKTTLETEIETLKNDKLIVNNNIMNLKASEITINQLNENLKTVQSTYNDIDTVKSALSPKSGIPLVFIKSYLDGTEAITNELLDIAYNGKFAIKFIPTADEFFIQVKNDNNIIDDIRSASAGEISLTSISISLALIERAMGDFNIMYLDEIDGPLDPVNRKAFINILNKQIAKLGLEQIFVISHNNAFNDCEMNLILLDGNTINREDDVFMNNKEIIYDVAA